MPTILLADNEPDWIINYKNDIRRHLSGWKFLEAGSAAAALRIVRSGEQEIHAAILDKNLEEKDKFSAANLSESSSHHQGFKVADEIRLNFPQAHITMMTGETFNGFFIQGLADGRFPVNAFGDKGQYGDIDESAIKRLITCLHRVEYGLPLPKFVFLTKFEEKKWGENFPRSVEFWRSIKPSGKER